jgi:hypothetical protein
LRDIDDDDPSIAGLFDNLEHVFPLRYIACAKAFQHDTSDMRQERSDGGGRDTRKDLEYCNIVFQFCGEGVSAALSVFREEHTLVRPEDL